MMVTTAQLDRFMTAHGLDESFRSLISNHYLPLAGSVVAWLVKKRPLVLGINGAQGTGKSTLADFLKLALESSNGHTVAVLSIDDFYLTKAERLRLADTVHPLLATRGVPGTHDTEMLRACLGNLERLESGERYRLPRFDKARDERAPESTWPEVTGPIHLVILEGWCVGSIAQADAELGVAANDLERERDPSGEWRRYVNERLKTDYADVFSALDALVFLKAPSFEAIYRWRLEQEHKLAATAGPDAAGVMDDRQVANFIQHYERITRSNLAVISSNADVVLEFDEYHNCIASHYRD